MQVNGSAIFVKLYCLCKGYRIKNITLPKQYKDVFDLMNDTYVNVYGFEPMQLNKEIIYPKGVAVCFGIYKKKELIGSMRLMDLTQQQPVLSDFYLTTKFDYDPKKTYELSRLIIAPKYQSMDRMIFLLLIYAAYRFTMKTGRNQWIVSTWKSIYYIIQRMGAKVDFITQNTNYIDDGSQKARLFKDYVKREEGFDFNCCFYVSLEKDESNNLLKKYIRRRLKRFRKRTMEKFMPLYS